MIGTKLGQYEILSAIGAGDRAKFDGNSFSVP